MAQSERIEFIGALGERLAARLDAPEGPVRAYALFAHCFACSKDVLAAARIAGRLAELAVAVLRFDFTGLGQSAGDFANTNFSSNVADLKAAAAWLRENRQAPALLIGHSLGGAAVIVAAADIPEAKAVAVIAAPSAAAHAEHNFKERIADIERDGEAQVQLGGRPFRVRRSFLEDIRNQAVEQAAAGLKRALLILHSPTDDVVGVENATKLFIAAKHPKSFVSLDGADHLLRGKVDAVYAAEVIAAWAGRYALPALPTLAEPAPAPVGVTAVAEETGASRLQNAMIMGGHRSLADEPIDLGGADTGPSPFDLLSGALAACTTMTVRLYADRKGWPLERVRAEVTHAKGEPVAGGRAPDAFHRTVRFDGPLDDEQRRKLLEIALKCPVHRVLEEGATVRTVLAES